jgi:O-antigen/teichoic acid export membrane protein
MSEGVYSSLRIAAKGAALVFAGMLASQALWFVTRLLIAKNLSKEDLGIYSLIVAIVSIIAPLASLGSRWRTCRTGLCSTNMIRTTK